MLELGCWGHSRTNHKVKVTCCHVGEDKATAHGRGAFLCGDLDVQTWLLTRVLLTMGIVLQ
jgi:hypothetical protein